jgi:CheY-like chemotaxis protein
MPDMSGYEVLAKVRRHDPSIPAIAITAGTYEADRAKAMAAEFTEFIPKPLPELPAFYDLIARHLRS